ncbi:hypothetical protein OXX59_004411 [Metschnikowia pulcherrima]
MDAQGSEQRLVLPSYTLDSPLVLLPGILYNVSFPRYKAAAFLARYREKAGLVPVIQSVLQEYEFDGPTSEIGHLSEKAVSGIAKFHSAEIHCRSSAPVNAAETEPGAEMDWLLVAVFPNTMKILENVDSHEPDMAVVCRVVAISDDSNTLKFTLQAIVRARPTNMLTKSETEFAVAWFESADDVKKLSQGLNSATSALFKSIDAFLESYKNALNTHDQKPDLLTLNPLANALFLQLAASKDFSRSYATLQKICASGANSASAYELSRVVDLTAAIVPLPNTKKLQILKENSLAERALLAGTIFSEMAEIFDKIRQNTDLANHWYHAEATGLQKATFVANQLKSIRVVLDGISSKRKSPQNQILRRKNGPVNVPKRKSIVGDKPGDNPGDNAQSGSAHDGNEEDDEEDDLAPITEFIKKQLPHITSISDDSKRLLVKDFRRVKNAPPGNGDYHVIRNYLEIVADMPWDTYVSRFSTNSEIDIDVARASLDQDHYGLQHVKTRLLQYLVVLKLLGAHAEKEYANGVASVSNKGKQTKESAVSGHTREPPAGGSIIVPSRADKSGHESEKVSQIQSDDMRKMAAKAGKEKALLASKNNKSPIIMLSGPPGVGKTSLAKSIATTLGRNFQRISLGGVKDESEIRGHRRTYVGAMAGQIVQALRKSRSMNPVILLDEIDKVVGGVSSGARVNGDPAAALLEVLDPEQNTQFVDHYLGFPIDLSQVIFICTANDPQNLSRPLLDRLERIEVDAYDYSDKLVIARKYLLPRQMKRNGLFENLVNIPEHVMKKVILDYTREAGVRNLERNLGTICRYKAVEYSESLASQSKSYNDTVEEYDLAHYLGLPFSGSSNEIVENPVMSAKYGVVHGLSYNTDGSGSMLIFESIGFDGGKGTTSLNMTGRLGEVLMESAKIGLTLIKNTFYRRLLNVDDSSALLQKLNNMEIHMHVPSGAVQKDGPSAGITMALSFLSLVLQRPVPSNIAMTGEITLRGLVLPIGGLKEKILGAHLTGQIDKVIVPRENRRDVLEEYVHKINDSHRLNALLRDDELGEYKDTSPEDYFADKYGIRIVYAKEFWDVIKLVWGGDLIANVEHSRLEEYHL